LTALQDRTTVVTLIDEAVAAGAGFCRACTTAGIDRRTYRRWLDRDTGEVRIDARPDTPRERPSQALCVFRRIVTNDSDAT